MTPTTPLESRLAEIRERCEKATPGRWESSDVNTNHFEVTSSDLENFFVADCRNQPDTEFIAHARQDVPFLLDALDRALEVVKAAENMFERMQSRAMPMSFEPLREALARLREGGG